VDSRTQKLELTLFSIIDVYFVPIDLIDASVW